MGASAQSLPTELITRTEQQQTADGASTISAATPDLSHLVLTSRAGNLADDAPPDGLLQQVYLHDRLAGTMQRISRLAGAEPDGSSRDGDVSDDASTLVFQSDATNLTLGDSNGQSDIFAFDVASEQFSMLSTNRFGTPANGASRQPVVSGNGRHVLFESRATNLDQGSGITRDYFDLFVLDRDVDGDGTLDESASLIPVRIVQSDSGMAAGPAFMGYDLSADGRYVVFSTSLRGVTADPVSAPYNLYFHDRDANDSGVFDEAGGVTTTLLSRNSSGAVFSTNATSPGVSRDGLTVIFQSNAPELDDRCVLPGVCDFYVFQINPSATTGEPDPTDTAVVFANRGAFPVLSANGERVSFQPDGNGELRTVDIASNTPQEVCLSTFLRRGNRGCRLGIPADQGDLTAFDSSSTNLVPQDVNLASDVFVFDAAASAPSSPPLGACEDQLDNDGNGLIDIDDPGCFAPEDSDEAPGEPVSVVAVTDARPVAGQFYTIDGRGLEGFDPDATNGPDTRRVVAYRTERYTEVPLPTEGNTDVKLQSFVQVNQHNPFHSALQTVGKGRAPKVATDNTGLVHLTYAAESSMFDQNPAIFYSSGDFSSVVQTAPPNCTRGATDLLQLNLDSANSPIIVFAETCTDSVWLWRPGQSPEVVTDLARPVELLAADVNILDETTVVAVEDSVDALGEARLNFLRLDSNDTLQRSEIIGVPDDPVDLAFASDVYGLAHMALTPQLFRSLRDPRPTMIYLVEQAGQLVRAELFLDNPARFGFEVEIYFDADGFTPNFILTDPNRPNRPPRRARLEQGNLVEVPSLPFRGQPQSVSAYDSSPGQVEYVYREASSGNILFADPDAAPWLPGVVTAGPNGQLRDLGVRSDGRGNGLLTALTFTSAFPGGVGELAVNLPQLSTDGWSNVVIAGAIGSDPVSLGPDGRSVAHYDNQSSTLKLYTELGNNVWSQETVTTLSGFDSLDDITLVANTIDGNESSALIVGVFRASGGESGDTLMAYQKRPRSSTWDTFPFSSAPITSINRVAAARYNRTLAANSRTLAAYSSAGTGEVRLAEFNEQSLTWSDELIDDGDSPVTIGNFLSIAVSEELRDGDIVRQRIPTVVYDIASRTRVRYASRFNAWRILEPDQTTPPGVLITGLDHQLINESRLRPAIAVERSDGELHLLSPTGSATGADAFQDERIDSGVNTDAVTRLVFDGRSFVGYSTDSASAMVRSGNVLGGLPVAGQSAPWENTERSESLLSVVTFTCLEFFFKGRSKLQQVLNGSASSADNRLPSDDSVLDSWGEIFQRSAAGQRYIDFFQRDFPKIARIAAQDPGLLHDAISTAQNFMPGITAMTNGGGDEAIITQAMMNDALDIWQRLSDRDSGTLSAFIETELAQWNDLQDFVGMSFDEWGTTIGLMVGPVSTDALFSDSFEIP